MAYSACPASTARAPHGARSETPAQMGALLRSVSVKLLDASSHLAARFARSAELRRQRRMLLGLSDGQLHDIGVTRAEAEEEYRKSFPII